MNEKAVETYNEIEKIQPPVAANESQAVLSMIERVVLNPEADMDKLDKMLDMQERILNRSAKQAFTADLAAMQTELPLVAKNGKGHNSAKYAKLEDINEAIRPALQKYGFAVTFRIRQSEKFMTVTALLSHKMGHSEETELLLPLDHSGSKNGVQAVGSTVSYGKRYTIGALLNISTGDDNDGGAPVVLISTEDAASIKSELKELNADVKQFCKYVGCSNVDAMNQNQIGKARHALAQKRKKSNESS